MSRRGRQGRGKQRARAAERAAGTVAGGGHRAAAGREAAAAAWQGAHLGSRKGPPPSPLLPHLCAENEVKGVVLKRRPLQVLVPHIVLHNRPRLQLGAHKLAAGRGRQAGGTRAAVGRRGAGFRQQQPPPLEQRQAAGRACPALFAICAASQQPAAGFAIAASFIPTPRGWRTGHQPPAAPRRRLARRSPAHVSRRRLQDVVQHARALRVVNGKLCERQLVQALEVAPRHAPRLGKRRVRDLAQAVEAAALGAPPLLPAGGGASERREMGGQGTCRRHGAAPRPTSAAGSRATAGRAPA